MSIKIIAVGDIMLGDQDLCAGFGVGSRIKKYGAEYLFNDVAAILKKGDLVFGNLECSINTDPKVNYKKSYFISDPAVVPALSDAGFNVLSVANNHIMENGDTIYDNTIQLLKQSGIIPVGCKDEVQYKIIDGKSIAFLGYSFIDDKIEDSRYNRMPDTQKIIDNIQQAKKTADKVILSLHWGLEYVPYASQWQMETAHKFVDSGADVILGGHSHVLQGYEIYNGKPIIYSLGNFIFDQTFNPATQHSAIFEIDIDDQSCKIQYTPIIINKKTYKPTIYVKSQQVSQLLSAINAAMEGGDREKYKQIYHDYQTSNNPYHVHARKYMIKHFIKNIWHYHIKYTSDTIMGYLFRGH